MGVEFRQAVSQSDIQLAKSVRLAVFVGEQNVPMDIEMDEHDASATHMVCLLGGKVVGTGRLVSMPDGVKLGRVAVLQEHRGKGLGTGIVKWLVARARESGTKSVYANVQIDAREFYEKLGFRSIGSIFMEANIEHIKMAIDL
jgi:predicted GNAT family N-acyltransferase